MIGVRRVFAVAAWLAALALFLAGPALSSGTGQVNATVTPLVIAIEVTPNVANYGSLEFSPSSEVTIKKELTGFIAKNVGSGAQRFEVQGTHAAGGGGAAWTLTTDPPGTNLYRHGITGVTGGTGGAINQRWLTTGQEPWANNGGPGYTTNQTQHFKLELQMPRNGSTGTGTTMNFQVIIVAIAN